MPETLIVFVAALVTALATGLGASPFFFVKSFSRWALAIANALAAGLMLAASHSLLVEGSRYGAFDTILGLLGGALFVALSHKLVAGRPDLSVGSMRGADARQSLLIVTIMTLHSMAEGVGVGVAYAGGNELGVFITTAIAVHNIPEGLAISLVLVPRGVSARAAAGWSVFSSLPQPLLAVPAFLFVTTFAPFLPVGFGLAAGAMIWLVIAELLPEALEKASRPAVATAVAFALAAMLFFQLWLRV